MGGQNLSNLKLLGAKGIAHMDRIKVEYMHVYTDETLGRAIYLAKTSTRTFICSFDHEDGAAEIKWAAEFAPMPTSIFDALIATLIAHPEMDKVMRGGE